MSDIGKMQESENIKGQQVFTWVLGLAFASVFFRHGLMNLVAILFIVALIVYRPKITWIPPLWWALGFSIWEWLSNYFGPYQGGSIEGLGIGYHYLFLLIPFVLHEISQKALFWGVLIGATSSAILLWLQGFYGMNINSTPFKIAWDTSLSFGRPAGFNNRPWETQFIHSMVGLVLWPYFSMKKMYAWILFSALFTGVVVPQVRAVFIGFIAGLAPIVLFLKGDNKNIVRKLLVLLVVTMVSIGIMAFLRPSFFKNLESGNNRDKIFMASYQVFKNNPHTGIGGGKYFHENYQQAWQELGMDGVGSFLYKIGHTHNDILMLLVHHGWPALLLWLGFVIHSYLFVWQYGSRRDRVLFAGLIIMHHVAGLAESYLDYSNTTYALLLCYGIAMHGALKNYKKQHQSLQTAKVKS